MSDAETTSRRVAAESAESSPPTRTSPRDGRPGDRAAAPAALDEQTQGCDAVLASKVAIEDRLSGVEAKDDAYVETLKKQAADVTSYFGWDDSFAERRGRSGGVGRLNARLGSRPRRHGEPAEIDALFTDAKSEQAARTRGGAVGALRGRAREAQAAMEVQHLEDSVGDGRGEPKAPGRHARMYAQHGNEYNYRVLVERDHENQSTMTQRKKIAKQREA